MTVHIVIPCLSFLIRQEISDSGLHQGPPSAHELRLVKLLKAVKDMTWSNEPLVRKSVRKREHKTSSINISLVTDTMTGFIE